MGSKQIPGLVPQSQLDSPGLLQQLCPLRGSAHSPLAPLQRGVSRRNGEQPTPPCHLLTSGLLSVPQEQG